MPMSAAGIAAARSSTMTVIPHRCRANRARCDSSSLFISHVTRPSARARPALTSGTVRTSAVAHRSRRRSQRVNRADGRDQRSFLFRRRRGIVGGTPQRDRDTPITSIGRTQQPQADVVLIGRLIHRNSRLAATLLCAACVPLLVVLLVRWLFGVSLSAFRPVLSDLCLLLARKRSRLRERASTEAITPFRKSPTRPESHHSGRMAPDSSYALRPGGQRRRMAPPQRWF